MRPLSSSLATHVASELTSLSTCFLVRRRDGVRMGFTTADQTIVIDGVPYLPGSGMIPSDISASRQMNVDEMEAVGILTSHGISESDLRAGRYDFAEIDIFLVNRNAVSDGKIFLTSGWLGEISTKDNAFVTEVRGQAQALQQTFGEVYSPECRADLGDARCRVDLAAHSVTAMVVAVSSRRLFTASSLSVSDSWYDYGLVRWMTGANAGARTGVKVQTGNVIELSDALSDLPAAGDVFIISAGCDKRFATCKAKFANAVNFRGEPHVPGIDSLLDYPGLG